jgi:hypothetical protein
MENIFEIRFSFEQKTKEEVIYKFSNKQGGDYNVFSFHWQCFVWAAIIGFLRNEKRPLTPPIADKPFSLNTMFNNGGGKRCPSFNLSRDSKSWLFRYYEESTRCHQPD